jgi:hypothetical protein
MPGAAQHDADGVEHIGIVIDYEQGRDGKALLSDDDKPGSIDGLLRRGPSKPAESEETAGLARVTRPA